MERRAFLLAVPAVAVVASRLPRDPFAWIRNFGHGTLVMLHGREGAWCPPPCQVCGDPGMTLARDAYEGEPVDGAAAYELGGLKVGCTAHPVESITYDRSGAVDTEAMEASRRLGAEARAMWRA